jgi:hypothetical protein
MIRFIYIYRINNTKIKDGKFQLVEQLFDHFSVNRKYWSLELEKIIEIKMKEFAETMPEIMKYEYMVPCTMEIEP